MTGDLDRLAHEKRILDEFDAGRPLPAGRLTPRQRLAALVDEGSFLEIGGFARSQQPDLQDSTPADGLITGWASVGGRESAVLVEDPLVLSRTDAEVAKDKRARQLANAVRLDRPIVYVFDAGRSDGQRPRPMAGDLFGHLAHQWPQPRISEHANTVIALVLGPVSPWGLEFVAAADLVIAGPGAAPNICVDIIAGSDAQACELARRTLALLPASALDPLPTATVPASRRTRPAPANIVADIADAESVIAWSGTAGIEAGVATIGGLPITYAVSTGRPLSTDDLRPLRSAARLSRKLALPLVVVQDCPGYAREARADSAFIAGLSDVAADIRASAGAKISVIAGQGRVLGTFVLGGRQLGFDYLIALPVAQIPAVDTDSYVADGEIIESDGPWLAAGMGLVDEVLAAEELPDYLSRMLDILGCSRGVPTVESQRGHRLVADIAKV